MRICQENAKICLNRVESAKNEASMYVVASHKKECPPTKKGSQKIWPPTKKYPPRKNSLMLGQSRHRLITLVACLHPCFFLLPVLSQPACPDMLQCSRSHSLLSHFSESHDSHNKYHTGCFF